MISALKVGADLGGVLANMAYLQSRAALTRSRRSPGDVPRAAYDPFDDAVLNDPYPAYRELLAAGPIVYTPARDLWVVCGWDALRSAAAAADVISSAESVIHPRHRLPMLVTLDRPDHARLRPVMAHLFRRAVVEDLRPTITHYADEGLARLADGADAVEALSVPVPVRVIADMLGVPSEDFQRFRTWSDDVVAGFGMLGVGSVRRLVTALAGLRRLVDRELDRPRDGDLLAALAAAVAEGTISRDEAFWFAVLLLVAGNETTTNLIGTLLHALASDREQFELLRADPSLVPAAVEEALRWVAPIQGFHRTALEPFGPIPAGSRVLLAFAAANRDPARFPDPDRFDLTRRSEHVAFGHGIHFCLGAHLARLEARIVLEVLLERGGEPRATGPVRWTRNPSLRGPASLPLQI